MKKFSKITIVLFAFSVLWTGFMLWNASRTGEQSRSVSDSITDTIKNSIENKNKVPSFFEGTEAIYSKSPEAAAEDEASEEKAVSVNAYRLKIFIRKSGHLLGYTMLSFLYAVTLISHRIQVDISFILSVLFGFVVACSDETIQSFTKGRNGSFSDVLIDTCGCIMGAFVAFTLLILYIFVKINFSKDKKANVEEKTENVEICN